MQASDGLLFSRSEVTVQVDLDLNATNAQSIKSNWFLVLNDEFDGTELDREIWAIAPILWGNVDERAQNSAVTNGSLVLKMRRFTNDDGTTSVVGASIRTTTYEEPTLIMEHRLVLRRSLVILRCE